MLALACACGLGSVAVRGEPMTSAQLFDLIRGMPPELQFMDHNLYFELQRRQDQFPFPVRATAPHRVHACRASNVEHQVANRGSAGGSGSGMACCRSEALFSGTSIDVDCSPRAPPRGRRISLGTRRGFPSGGTGLG
jgi:hypothetical protein